MLCLLLGMPFFIVVVVAVAVFAAAVVLNDDNYGVLVTVVPVKPICAKV